MAGNRLLLCVLLAGAFGAARAQTVINDREMLDSHRPEAWAMEYMSAATMMTPGGAPPALAPGRWQLSLDAGSVPRLSDEQRRVGFDAFKLEDLNRSPVFARLRAGIGLPGGFVAELGYTPPLRVDGVKLEQMWAGAISRRLLQRDPWILSARLFGQHGYAVGDITCPADAVGSSDPDVNPFDCAAPSHDRFSLNHYGADLGLAYTRGRWQGQFDLGLLKLEPEVKLDALTFGGDFRDRTHLLARDRRVFFLVGLHRELAPGWSLGMELLHVPMDVQRGPEAPVEDDPLTSLRLQLRWTPGAGASAD